MSSNDTQPAQPSGKQKVLVNVILDKSGSMSSKVQDVIGGFNLYLDELAKEPAVDYGFSLTLFDTVVEMKYKAVPLAESRETRRHDLPPQRKHRAVRRSWQYRADSDHRRIRQDHHSHHDGWRRKLLA